MNLFPAAEIIIMAAAVADFTVAHPDKNKIKKSKEGTLTLRLSSAPDILKEMGKKKKKKQFLAGFALESNNEFKNAISKLENKNLDMIVLNSIKDAGSGFEYDTNRITIIGRNKKKITFPLKLKTEVSKDIADFIKKNHHE
jgi:phosphopantothenoylcysteine decarboxylase/phosphopantothenate--cysteine ligase